MLVLAQELGRHQFVVHGPHFLVGAVAMVVTGACVFFHYEVMSRVSARLARVPQRKRTRIVPLMLVMLVAHVIEIWVFGLTFYALDLFPRLGALDGPMEEGAFDFIYFSAATYTTLGYGDLVPTGALRILTGTEALVGLGLITWTASLLFLEMQRDWAEFRRPKTE